MSPRSAAIESPAITTFPETSVVTNPEAFQSGEASTAAIQPPTASAGVAGTGGVGATVSTAGVPAAGGSLAEVASPGVADGGASTTGGEGGVTWVSWANGVPPRSNSATVAAHTIPGIVRIVVLPPGIGRLLVGLDVDTERIDQRRAVREHLGEDGPQRDRLAWRYLDR
jgi:hypothetical protein